MAVFASGSSRHKLKVRAAGKVDVDCVAMHGIVCGMCELTFKRAVGDQL